MFLKKCIDKCENYFYFVFRVIVGLTFFTHGVQKLFGWFGGLGGSSVSLFSIFGLAGIIETFAGLLIALGLFTRLAAFFGATEMFIAYLWQHLPNSPIPLLNQGEPAILFFAAFLILKIYGAKKYSLEKYLFKKEKF